MPDGQELVSQEDVAHDIEQCRADDHIFEVLVEGFVDPKNPDPFLEGYGLRRQIRWCSFCGTISLEIWFNSSNLSPDCGYRKIANRIPKTAL